MHSPPRTLRLLILLIAATLGIQAASGLGLPAPAHAATEYGVHMDASWDGYQWRRDQVIAQARDVLHAQVARNSFLWHLIEPTEGHRDWSRMDSLVDGLTSAGIDPEMVVYGSPSWANGTPTSTSSYYLYVPTDDAAFQRWVDQYVDFMREAVRRYRGRVEKWELWNEQNLHWNWNPAPSVDQYARWYTAVRNAILEEDPNAQVAIGGLGGLSATGPNNIKGLDFLDQLLARGIKPDYVAIHPYSGQQQAPDTHIRYETNFDDIALVHDHLTARGSDAPIWVTEWGWPTTQVDLATQAAYLIKSLQMIETQYTYVKLATYFINYDRAAYSYGLFDSSLNPKPAALAFGQFMDSLKSAPPSEPEVTGPPDPGLTSPPGRDVTNPPAAPPVQVPTPDAAPRPTDPATGTPGTPAAIGSAAPRVARMRARWSGRKLTVTATVSSCAGCRAILRIKAGHKTRKIRMRRRHGSFVAAVRRIRHKRLRYRVVVSTRGKPARQSSWRTVLAKSH